LIQREKRDRTRVKKKEYQDQHTGCALLALPLSLTSGRVAGGCSTAANTDSRDVEYDFGRLESELIRRARCRSRRRDVAWTSFSGSIGIRQQKHIGQPSRVHGRILRGTTIVTKFLGRWGRGTGSWYVVRYLRETFTLRVENEPVNPGRGRRT
jgi:hypothetical protein